jgi:hypothetical protein
MYEGNVLFIREYITHKTMVNKTGREHTRGRDLSPSGETEVEVVGYSEIRGKPKEQSIAEQWRGSVVKPDLEDRIRASIERCYGRVNCSITLPEPHEVEVGADPHVEVDVDIDEDYRQAVSDLEPEDSILART